MNHFYNLHYKVFYEEILIFSVWFTTSRWDGAHYFSRVYRSNQKAHGSQSTENAGAGGASQGHSYDAGQWLCQSSLNNPCLLDLENRIYLQM